MFLECNGTREERLSTVTHHLCAFSRKKAKAAGESGRQAAECHLLFLTGGSGQGSLLFSKSDF